MTGPENPQDKGRMQLTSLTSLLWCVLVVGVVMWLVVGRVYGSLATFTVWVSVPLVLLTLGNCVVAWYVRRSIERNRMGQDRRQLHPVQAARALAVGRASAWAGAVFVGVGLGSGAYVWPQAHLLAAARADTPGVIVFCVAGLLLAVSGLVVERACRVPPTGTDEENLSPAGV